jgi:Ca-activated chloride channel homolog
VTLPYTGNVEEASKALDRMYSSGGTALLDGISQAVKYTKENATNRRRALVVMTDGDERDSVLKKDQLLDQIKEEDVQIYLMGFPEGLIGADGAFMEASAGKAKDLLKKVAEESGGQSFFPQSLNEISPLAVKIGEELRAQYTIGYYPSNEQRDGRYHRLHVKLGDSKTKFAVRTRNGYYAGK